MNMEELTAADCGRPMTEQESRQVQLNMLEALAAFCDRNGLRYYLSGGTLLGAIRHKGFIPWDDDIDINIPRPDCEKLFQLTNGQIESYKLVPPFDGSSFPNYGYYRLYDPATVLKNTCHGLEKEHPYYQSVFIDIFPIDGLPDKDRLSKNLYKKIFVLQKMLTASSLKHLVGKNLLAKSLYMVAVLPAKLVGRRRWIRWLSGMQQKYSFDDCSFIGVTSSVKRTIGTRIRKQDYINMVDVEFEGKIYHAPQNYDAYLTQLYGAYMELPPEDKRRSVHDFQMFWRKFETKSN